MAYFPNGTSFEFYYEEFCLKCLNLKDGGCPITDLHMRWNYQAVGENSDAVKKEALENFIPTSPDGLGPEQCRMFIQSPQSDPSGK